VAPVAVGHGVDRNRLHEPILREHHVLEVDLGQQKMRILRPSALSGPHPKQVFPLSSSSLSAGVMDTELTAETRREEEEKQ
jgi:hypothetical protein